MPRRSAIRALERSPSNDTDHHAFAACDNKGASPVERVGHDDGHAWRSLRRRILQDLAPYPEGDEMMSGYVDGGAQSPVSRPARQYQVIARAGGWSVSLNGACTRPFKSRRAAERIARMLQRQADGLANGPRPSQRHHA